MDLQRFTESTRAALTAAQSHATESGNQRIEPEHLLLAMLDQENGLTVRLLEKLGIDIDNFRCEIEKTIHSIPRVSGPG